MTFLEYSAFDYKYFLTEFIINEEVFEDVWFHSVYSPCSTQL